MNPSGQNVSKEFHAPVFLFTGNGKGKTTAALGMALQAAGCGEKCMVIQFMKARPYSELDAVRRLAGLVVIEQHGSPDFCVPDEKNLAHHRAFAASGLARAHQALADPAFSLVILDEIVTALYFTLVTLDEIKALIAAKQDRQALVLTGRYAPPELVDLCDGATEMAEVRHYYAAGVEARKGIEM
ncbi:MAG: cob(I)yrinic acid a,c-diamide adenosyltransferase [Thermodesulfobacteriota bacterium]|nr:cob(I)yrinic acid a,c-diamide adenosyltransferase [Thermodesulfobacteriota bacterium]